MDKSRKRWAFNSSRDLDLQYSDPYFILDTSPSNNVYLDILIESKDMDILSRTNEILCSGKKKPNILEPSVHVHFSIVCLSVSAAFNWIHRVRFRLIVTRTLIGWEVGENGTSYFVKWTAPWQKFSNNAKSNPLFQGFVWPDAHPRLPVWKVMLSIFYLFATKMNKCLV